jgi:hypothetical protein
MSQRLFIGVYSTGLSYADRERERDGDYLKLAFLPYRTLKLEWSRGVRVPPELRKEIEESAFKMQCRAGEDFKISSSGQTVKLGV